MASSTDQWRFQQIQIMTTRRRHEHEFADMLRRHQNELFAATNQIMQGGSHQAQNEMQTQAFHQAMVGSNGSLSQPRHPPRSEPTYGFSRSMNGSNNSIPTAQAFDSPTFPSIPSSYEQEPFINASSPMFGGGPSSSFAAHPPAGAGAQAVQERQQSSQVVMPHGFNNNQMSTAAAAAGGGGGDMMMPLMPPGVLPETPQEQQEEEQGGGDDEYPGWGDMGDLGGQWGGGDWGAAGAGMPEVEIRVGDSSIMNNGMVGGGAKALSASAGAPSRPPSSISHSPAHTTQSFGFAPTSPMSSSYGSSLSMSEAAAAAAAVPMHMPGAPSRPPTPPLVHMQGLVGAFQNSPMAEAVPKILLRPRAKSSAPAAAAGVSMPYRPLQPPPQAGLPALSDLMQAVPAYAKSQVQAAVAGASVSTSSASSGGAMTNTTPRVVMNLSSVPHQVLTSASGAAIDDTRAAVDGGDQAVWKD
ncbi:unnamed protein product [Vitrella brassicaformis CCMP3155]|uniref:Uncharacterized protein n=1 Tax=Vitrella brassicaformis (strain CCMP3155) TaxID=1169540 RepID=A0A0G4E848_VITBC|nr:unnamed protein product [Vitrella brassicaformis CCMP3155]|eukprot:CEL91609.1 unnamed protein product [Vitrella brassicaformis CCMP3155]